MPETSVPAAETSRSLTDERGLESLALGAGAAAFVVTAAAALLAFRLQPAPISGPDSAGQFAAVMSAAVAIVAFVAGRLLLRDRAFRRGGGILDIVDVAALAFAHGVIALLSWTLVANLLERGFIGAEVFPVALVFVTAAAAAVTGYLVFFSATHMDLNLLSVVLAVFLIEGILASMLTASDPDWWHDNLSALGMTSDLSGITFNLTIIVSGILVTTLARYVTRGLAAVDAHGAARVRTTLLVVGVFLGLVGVFPVDDFFALHTGVASGMAVAFGVLVIRLHHWLPDIPRPFLLLGWVFVAVIVVTAVMFAVGYWTLTAVELVAGAMVFTWLILFIRTGAALQADAAGGARPR